MYGCMSMVLMSSMIQALTGIKLYSPIVPIVANDTVDSTNDGLCCYLWCYWLIMIVKLIEHGLVVTPTGYAVDLSIGLC